MRQFRSFPIQIEPIPRLREHGDASTPVGPSSGCGILPGEGHALQGRADTRAEEREGSSWGLNHVVVGSHMRRVRPVADTCQGVPLAAAFLHAIEASPRQASSNLNPNPR